jgi:pSer/pThr/pTyr-binding forkhead associated (FHA) protein
MPVIRCPQCSQAYDIPPAVAVRLPVTVANCSCGFWLCGDREKLLQQLSETGSIEELDVSPFKVDDVAPSAAKLELDYESTGPAAATPRHIHIVARGSDASIDTTFTITGHPLWIGRKGCHIEFDDAELSLQHCSIEARGARLIVRDADSHTGTFLDGEEISEAEIGEGVHLLRVGRALLCLEPVDTPGRPVEPVVLDNLFEAPPQLTRKAQPKNAGAQHLFLRGVAGPATGMEYDLDLATNTVGREGSIRVPDEYLSRKHFEIFRDDEGHLRIRDLGSRNGTFLNTLPARNTKVTAGDEIRAGMTVFRVEAR